MSKVVKVEFILVTLVYFLSGIYTQSNMKCRQIDFNEIDSISEFEPCFTGTFFSIKSYSEEILEPYRPDSVNYLSNVGPGWSCFSSIESFTLDENTEFYSAIYLQSSVIDTMSILYIQVYDTEGPIFLIVEVSPTARPQWNEFYYKFNTSVENAQIEIRAFLETDTILAIEYLHFINSGSEEPECVRDIETTTETTEATTETTEATTETTETTTETTETTTETTEQTTEISLTTSTTTPMPVDSNENNVWIILSFVFFSITIIVIVGSVYLIYLYKTTLAMKNSLLSASTQSTQTSLPRLTVATSGNGPVIVGIEKIKPT